MGLHGGIVHDAYRDDAAVAFFTALCGGAGRERACRCRPLVRRRLRRHLFHCRAHRAIMGTPGGPLRTQTDANPRQPRHGDRHVVNRHGQRAVAAGGAAAAGGLARRLRFGRDHFHRRPDAESSYRLGAGNALVWGDGGQCGRAVDRWPAAAADRHSRYLLAGGRRHLSRLSRHQPATERGAASCAAAATERNRRAQPAPGNAAGYAAFRHAADLRQYVRGADYYPLRGAVCSSTASGDADGWRHDVGGGAGEYFVSRLAGKAGGSHRPLARADRGAGCRRAVADPAGVYHLRLAAGGAALLYGRRVRRTVALHRQPDPASCACRTDGQSARLLHFRAICGAGERAAVRRVCRRRVWDAIGVSRHLRGDGGRRVL